MKRFIPVPVPDALCEGTRVVTPADYLGEFFQKMLLNRALCQANSLILKEDLQILVYMF